MADSTRWYLYQSAKFSFGLSQSANQCLQYCNVRDLCSREHRQLGWGRSLGQSPVRSSSNTHFGTRSRRFASHGRPTIGRFQFATGNLSWTGRSGHSVGASHSFRAVLSHFQMDGRSRRQSSRSGSGRIFVVIFSIGSIQLVSSGAENSTHHLTTVVVPRRFFTLAQFTTVSSFLKAVLAVHGTLHQGATVRTNRKFIALTQFTTCLSVKLASKLTVIEASHCWALFTFAQVTPVLIFLEAVFAVH